jgi:hypothetical protein
MPLIRAPSRLASSIVQVSCTMQWFTPEQGRHTSALPNPFTYKPSSQTSHSESLALVQPAGSVQLAIGVHGVQVPGEAVR